VVGIFFSSLSTSDNKNICACQEEKKRKEKEKKRSYTIWKKGNISLRVLFLI